MDRSRGNSDEFFAAIKDPVKLADAMKDKIQAYREWCNGRGLTQLWNRKLMNYYGRDYNGNSSQQIVAGGTEGELALIKVNDLRNLIQNQLVIVTAQRPAGIATAVNADTKSQKAARVGTAVSEYYMTHYGFESKFTKLAEIALLLDESYNELFFDKMAGDAIMVDPETGMPEMAGDVLLRNHCPWNVARDIGMDIDNQDWHIISFRANRFNQAAAYPRFKEAILSDRNDDLPSIPMNYIPEGSDAVYCHLLVADKCASLPEGRYALMINSQVVFDLKLPFPIYPINRMAPGDVIDGPMGYSAANDVLAMEQTTDALYSIITTNNCNFGGTIIVGPQGADLNVKDLAKGVRYFELPPDMIDKLKPLQLTKSAPEAFQFINMLNAKKEQQLGINSVVRGNPEGQLSGSSGSALALVQTQAISFNSGIQKSYFQVLSDTMTKLIIILSKFADTDRVARIVGKANNSFLKEYKYSGQDLLGISSIVYETVNPLSQTYGGRLQMAQDLLQAGQLKSPKQYITLAATGNLDVLTQDDEADGLLILEENEWLSEGRHFQAVITQQHEDHIKSHTSQITLEAQERDPNFVTRVLNHIQDHVNLWTQATINNPGILIATNQKPLNPPNPGAPGPVGPAGGSPPPPPSAPGVLVQHRPGTTGPLKKLSSGAESPSSPILKKAQEVNEPNLPTIAGTNGQKPMIPGVTNI